MSWVVLLSQIYQFTNRETEAQKGTYWEEGAWNTIRRKSNSPRENNQCKDSGVEACYVDLRKSQVISVAGLRLSEGVNKRSEQRNGQIMQRIFTFIFKEVRATGVF